MDYVDSGSFAAQQHKHHVCNAGGNHFTSDRPCVGNLLAVLRPKQSADGVGIDFLELVPKVEVQGDWEGVDR